MQLKRSLAWTSLGQTLFFIIQFTGSVVLARLLSPREMGVYAIAAAVVGLLSLIQGLGLRSFVVREPALGPEAAATAFSVNALFACGLGLLTAAAGAISQTHRSGSGVASVLYALALLPIIGIGEFLPSALLERDGRFRGLVLAGVVRNFATTVSTVLLAYAGWSSLSVAYGQIAGALAGAAAINLAGREYVSFRVSLTGWRRISTFGAHMLTMTGAGAIAQRASELILAKLGGLGALGLYNRASTLNTLFFSNLHLVVGRVLFVDMAQKCRDGVSLRSSYLRIIEMTTAALWPAFTGLAVLSHPLFALVYGPKWIAAATPFALLAMMAVAHIAVTLVVELFTITQQTGQQVRLELFRAGLGTALFAGGAAFGVTGAAAARLIDAIISIFLYRPHIERMTDTTLADALPIYGRSALLTGLAVGPAAMLMRLTSDPVNVPILQLAAVIAAGLILWAIGLWALKHPLFQEGALLLRRRRTAPAAA